MYVMTVLLNKSHMKGETIMKTMKPLIGLVIIILGVAVLFSGGTTYAKTYELSLSLVTPPAHLRNKHVIRPWIQMLEERSGGKLKVTPYYANALAPFPEQFDAARKGIAAGIMA